MDGFIDIAWRFSLTALVLRLPVLPLQRRSATIAAFPGAIRFRLLRLVRCLHHIDKGVA